MNLKKNINISVIIITLLTSCNYFKNKKTATKMKEYKEYKDLHENQGTENYEVIKLLDKKTIIDELLLDKKQKLFSVVSDGRLKIDFFGNIINNGYTYETLKDGTMWGIKTYSNWFINNDETIHKYTEPFTNKKIDNVYEYKNSETDYKKWLLKFKELYNKATYIHTWNSFYYFKINEKWYLMKDDLKNSPMNFKEQYPEKINPDEIRMVKIPNLRNIIGNKIKIIKYIEQDSEKSVGINPINFSSGYYMLDFHLPMGDILKFRRYGAMGVSSEMFIYQIPKELGGSDEVFFIEQEPNEMYPNKSFAGFYAIRPKNYKELPEYKPYEVKEKKKH